MNEIRQIEKILKSIKSKNELKLLTTKETKEIMKAIFVFVQSEFHKMNNSWLQQLVVKGKSILTIKGTDYTIIADDYAFKVCCDSIGGCTFVDSKEIILPTDFSGHALLHELVHAYLFECTLNCYSSDELLVDSIAYLIEYFFEIGIGL